MRNPSFYRPTRNWLILGLAGLALTGNAQTNDEGGWEQFLGLQKVSAAKDDWTRHFRIGAVVGFNISANFNENGPFNISGNNAANGIFNDGYVRADQTINPGGYTSYWGYNNASQYNAAAQTLTMHSTTSYAATGNSKVDAGPSPGFEMAYGGNLWYWREARIGWELGFGLVPISLTDNSTLPATVNQNSYTYSTGGIVVPGAPYQGGPSGLGPLLSDSYASSPIQSSTAGIVTGSRTLDVTLYTLRLGPSFYWDLSPKVSMSSSFGPAIGIASGTYTFNETITTGSSSAHNTGSFGGTDFVYGGYANTLLLYHMVDNGRNVDIYIGAQYMPLGNATFSSAGREGQLNLSGQFYLSAGINWPF